MDYVVETHGIDLDRPGIEVLGDVIERTWLKYSQRLSCDKILSVAGDVFDVLTMNLHIYEIDARVMAPVGPFDPELALKQLAEEGDARIKAYVDGEQVIDFKNEGKRRPGQGL